MGFRDARISAGLSVSQVMKNIGVSDAAVYQWETGVGKEKQSGSMYRSYIEIQGNGLEKEEL